MNFHTPTKTISTVLPVFAEKNGTIVSPEKMFTQEEYPNLPYDMIKITAQDGRKIYVHRDKVHSMDV